MKAEVTTLVNPYTLDTANAAVFVGVAKSDLDRSRIEGDLRGITPPPFFRIGRSVRYRVSDLKLWVERQASFITNAEAEAAQ